MVQFLVELDDRCARDLERVAPARKRLRSEFVRLAIRRAVDLALDLETAAAYASTAGAGAEPGSVLPADRVGWDPDNALARPAVVERAPRARPAAKGSARPRVREPARKRAG